MTNNILVTAAEIGILAVTFILVYRLLHLALTDIFPGSRLTRRRGRDKRAGYVRTLRNLTFFGFSISCIGLLGLNSYAVYRGDRVLDFQLELLNSVPLLLWQNTAIALGKCLALIVFIRISLNLLLRKVILIFQEFVKRMDDIEENDASVARFFNVLERIVMISAWVGTVIACLLILDLPERVVGFTYWAFGVYLSIAMGLLTARAVPIAIDTLDALSVRSSTTYNVLGVYQRFRHLIPLLKRCLEFIIYVVTTSLILRYSSLVSWLTPYVNKAAGIIAIYFLTRAGLSAVDVGMTVLSRQSHGLPDIQRQRRATIIPLAKDLSKYAIYLLSAVGVLGTLGVNLTPILAGVGILGLAIGFGAQNLVEDIVSGLFVLFENYYLVGDYVAAGRMEERPVEGIVEAIELRTTRLRHPDGQVQIVRNGEIGSVVNYSKQYIYATVDIPLAYEEKLETVYPIILSIGQQIKAEHPEKVLEPTNIEGLESLGKNLVLVRTITKVKPGQHLHIQRLLRKMLKDNFEKNEIELADYEPNPTVES